MATNTPEPSALQRLMGRRGMSELPPARWTSVEEVGRRSIESFVAQQEGDARTISSAGELRLHGAMVENHRADLDDVSRVALAWQRALNAVGAAMEGVTSTTGRLGAELTERLQLQLVAAPAPGSLVLKVAPKANALGEVDGADGTRRMALGAAARPLADRASGRLISLCDDLAHGDLADDNRNADQLRGLGPRTARAISSLAAVLASSNLDLDVAWREPGQPTRRTNFTSSQADRVKKFVEGRHLDAEELSVVGVAHTVSDVDKWVIEVDGINERFDAGDLPREAWRGKFRIGDEVHLLVSVTTNERPDGTTRYHRRVVQLQRVVPVEELP
ncbi:hypothetical protein [Intrasporangium sp. YIM S08009]|uniref:hypothetical protein n=1 Tax=Intrasporangium zincisolvens TaxID=3080018 RepID=UPI002B05B731|nr:hypothetical protein [Intrasporangium sp. YIM S08009]